MAMFICTSDRGYRGEFSWWNGAANQVHREVEKLGPGWAQSGILKRRGKDGVVHCTAVWKHETTGEEVKFTIEQVDAA